MCPKSYRLVLLNDEAGKSSHTFTINPVSSDIPQDGLMKVEVEEIFVELYNLNAAGLVTGDYDFPGPMAVRMSLNQPCSVSVSSTKGVIRNDLLTLLGPVLFNGTGENQDYRYAFGVFNSQGNEVIVPSPYGKDVTISFTDRFGNEKPVYEYTLVLKLTPVDKDHHTAMMY